MACCALLAALVLLAALDGAVAAQDLPDAKDHPAISRYAGSTIIGYDSRDFDQVVLPLGPAAVDMTGHQAVKKSRTAEGRVTRIVYLAPAERSTLEVLRNYEQELKKDDFQILFSCATTTCSAQDGGLVQALYPLSRSSALKGKDLSLVLTMPQEQRYLAAKRSSASGDLYASVLVAKDTNPGVPRSFNRAVVLLEIVETAPMESGLVKVDAAAMGKALRETGHIALYGIYFDTNKADLKPESQAVIQEIASLLKQDASLRLLVVGHTDNVGGYDANVTLSERRAQTVLRELVSAHGVAAARLRAVGVGMAAPVATNDTEEGRAKNRRVELVRQ